MSALDNYPPGADEDLRRRERESEENAEHLAEIERLVVDNPAELIGYLDENEISRRLERMLRICRNYHVGGRRDHTTLTMKIMSEWEGAVLEAVEHGRREL